MQRYAFKMYLRPGKKAEYQKRHNEIWPELAELLRASGICNYSIHLDEETNTLFGYLERSDNHKMADLPNLPVMQRWWRFMGDIMQTNADGSPVAILLNEMFYMK